MYLLTAKKYEPDNAWHKYRTTGVLAHHWRSLSGPGNRFSWRSTRCLFLNQPVLPLPLYSKKGVKIILLQEQNTVCEFWRTQVSCSPSTRKTEQYRNGFGTLTLKLHPKPRDLNVASHDFFFNTMSSLYFLCTLYIYIYNNKTPSF